MIAATLQRHGMDGVIATNTTLSRDAVKGLAAGALPKFRWTLASAVDAKGQPVDALLVRPDRPLTLEFKQGKLAIGNTCNRMLGAYSLRGNGMTVGELASTLMACPDPKLMALDREVGKRLQGKLACRRALQA